jgi:alkanesulfonate monooxygenase SsuD/methylene tetrahydromethanopterin reductase-like flavin-dependent oxidoreductase (luciferase family)
MRLGVTLAQTGRRADPASLRWAACAAEQLGFSSVWTLDRPRPAITAPGHRRAPQPVPVRHPAPDDARARRAGVTDPDAGPRPASLDALSALAFAAAVTNRVRLATGVLEAPWYRPEVLARSLVSLAVLSDGRLTVGLGAGGAPDDPATVGMAEHARRRSLEVTLDLLDAEFGRSVTTTGPTVTRSADAASATRPPVMLACDTADGLERIARRADGWLAAGVPVPALGGMWAATRDLAASHGRDPNALELVVRADITLTDRPIDGTRPSYAGTVEQVAADLVDTRRAGAHEVVLALQGDRGLDEALDVHARLAEAVGLAAVA